MDQNPIESLNSEEPVNSATPATDNTEHDTNVSNLPHPDHQALAPNPPNVATTSDSPANGSNDPTTKPTVYRLAGGIHMNDPVWMATDQNALVERLLTTEASHKSDRRKVAQRNKNGLVICWRYLSLFGGKYAGKKAEMDKKWLDRNSACPFCVRSDSECFYFRPVDGNLVDAKNLKDEDLEIVIFNYRRPVIVGGGEKVPVQRTDD